MKAILTLIGLFISMSIYSQKTDWVNAPLNPIAFEYKLEHFNLKGDIYANRKQMFSKEGLMIFENQFSTESFLYKNNQLYADTSGRLFEFNSQGYISKMTYASSGVQTQSYTYNNKGLLIKVTNTKGYNAVYDYDINNRLIKSVVSGVTKEYSYQKKGEELLITEKDLSKSPITQSILIYKNGHLIGKDDNRFNNNYDKYGNLISPFMGETLFYSEVENKTNEISLVYEKPSYGSINLLYGCKFYINNKRVEILFTKVINRKDLMIYDPFKQKYLIIEDAFNDTKSGKKQVFSKVYIDAHSFLDFSESFEQLCYKGTSLVNALYLRKSSLKVYNQYNNYICYDDFIDKTLFCKFNPNEKFSFYPLQEVNSKENLFFLKGNDGIFYVEKGKVLSSAEHTFAYNNNDIVLFKNNEPKYYFPNYKNALDATVYPGRAFNNKTDTYTLEQSNSNQNNVTETNLKTPITPDSYCVSGNCTDGYGELKLSKSNIIGFFKNGKANGYGKEVFNDGSGYYQGTFKDGFRDGYGYYEWLKLKQSYIGFWKSGYQHGYGYYIEKGIVFQAGYYENGKQTRNMLTQDFKNQKLVGNCIGDCVNGFGSYKYSNGDIYTGFFSNNNRNYVGGYTWASGNIYTGEYYNNLGNGQGEEYYGSSGTIYRGAFSNGKRHGLGAYFNKSGAIQSKGYWENGELKTTN